LNYLGSRATVVNPRQRIPNGDSAQSELPGTGTVDFKPRTTTKRKIV
jgi:hypothetical protein